MSSTAFFWYDYLFLVAMLVISTSIGIFFGYCRRNEANSYLLGGKNMKIVPVGVSLSVSHFSAIILVATPSEVFRYGSAIGLACVSMFFVTILGLYVFLPVFYKLQYTSLFEYIQKRFDKRTRLMVFILYFFNEFLRLPVHIYAASLVFTIVTDGSLYWMSFIMSAVCIFYTAIGGFKTVVWTDVFQYLLVLIGLVTIFGIGINESSGFQSVWKTALDGRRLEVFDFSPDFTKRNNFWVIVVGYTAHYLSGTMVHQSGVQKYLSLPTFQDCIWTAILATACTYLVFILSILIGLLIYARYSSCDPLTNHQVDKHDEILPFYFKNVIAGSPCVSGIFMTALFSSSLSSVSSNLNSWSGVIYRDVIMRFVRTEVSEARKNQILKLIVVVTGVLSTSLIFAISNLGDILTIAISAAGITNAPILGLFILGVLCPNANAVGAFYGALTSFVLLAFVIVTSNYYQIRGWTKYETLPISVEGCDGWNGTLPGNAILITHEDELQPSFQPSAIFRMSFHCYAALGTGLTVALGLGISFLARRQRKEYDEDLLCPVVKRFVQKKSNERHNVEYSVVDQALTINHASK